MCGTLLQRRLWIVGLSVAVLWGCDREPATGPAPFTPPPGDTIERIGWIVVSRPPERFSVGDSTLLTAVVMSQTNKVMAGQTVHWTSSDPSTARVSEQGVVRAEKVGFAIITASVGEKFSGVHVNVYPGACTHAAATIEIGQARTGALNSHMTCLLRGEPADGWQVNLTASTLLRIDLQSSMYFGHLMLTDTQLKQIAHAEYTGSGMVTMRSSLAAGSYIVWVAADGDDGNYELSVKAVVPADTIERVDRIVISRPPERFSMGDSTQLTAVVLSETGKVMTGQSVRWTSSHPSVARVSEQGVVRGEGVGNAIITASVDGKVAAVNLSVFPRNCTQAVATIELGQVRSGYLASAATCLLLDEPADGWQINLTAPTLLQIDLKSDLYFGHVMLTDAQLTRLDQGYHKTLRRQLPAGSYIVWVAADGDDGAYELSVNAVPSGSEAVPGVASTRVMQSAAVRR